MLNLNVLNQQVIEPGTKGFAITDSMSQADVPSQHWNVLKRQVSFPVAILKKSALQNNLKWMKDFCDEYQIVLAPHGKTTLSPQLFQQQLEHGAWGITLANINQAQMAARFGVRKILIANQIVNSSEIRCAIALQNKYPDLELYLLVDSQSGCEQLLKGVKDTPPKAPMRILLELGFTGGRTGCRSFEQAEQIAKVIYASPDLALFGVEGYEGLIVTAQREKDLQAVREFLGLMRDLLERFNALKLFQTGEQKIIVSAGGSAYFDLVAEFMKEIELPILSILRSGCYVTHDHGFYHGLLREMQTRHVQSPLLKQGLHPALEVWAMVQSRPEPDLAILTMGKRDASYDIDLPQPLRWHRLNASMLNDFPSGCKIEKMNDQHAYLRLPAGSDVAKQLQVGDIVACGISHPCTTFDKWSHIMCVDDQYHVVDVINTQF